jgi:hypothetical protein
LPKQEGGNCQLLFKRLVLWKTARLLLFVCFQCRDTCFHVCKGTTSPLRSTNAPQVFLRSFFTWILRSFWSFGHLVKIVSALSKSTTIK